MKLLVEIPEEQIEKSLAESKFIHEDEGVKGHVDVIMLYTNGKLEFVDVSRKTDFYSCGYQILPDDCEILTREAYEDLCKRASMSEQERWQKGL
jgi:hypothetical protein